jgi:feruloyl esterase
MRLGLMIGCATALAGLAGVAHAAPACTAEALNALHTPDVNVTEAKAVAATAQTPAHCQVTGTVVTRGMGLPEGSARFLMLLPEQWKQRFLAYGEGGNAGNLNPSANPADRAEALAKGYVTIVDDTGHVGGSGWVRKPDGSVDKVKATDFFYRGNHSATVAGKAFAQAYYSAPVLHAYFEGCSSGGKMAMAGAEHYPDDYQGVIAGDPSMDYTLGLARLLVMRAVLSSPNAFIPQDLLTKIDERIIAKCDSLDGAKDGLVQNPAACPVKAEDLLCKPGVKAACLNADQVAVIKNFTTSMRDSRGKVLYAGWPITHMSGQGGAGAWDIGRTAPDLSDSTLPWTVWDEKSTPAGWNFAKQTFGDWMGYGPERKISSFPIDVKKQVIGDELLKRNAEVFDDGVVNDPAHLKAFIAKGGKVIMYHGTADPALPYMRSVQFFQKLSAIEGSPDKARRNMRLFLVPGMQHCGGGIGPDRFETLSALENWVENGQAPTAIAASTRPDLPVQHNLPLCPYPQQGRYSGTGDITDASNWSCKAPPAAAKAAAAKTPAAG